MCSTTNASTSKPFTSALLSAFLKITESFKYGIIKVLPEQLKEELSRLDWPPTLCDSPGLRLRLSANGVIEATKWHNLLLFFDVLQEANRTFVGHTLQGASGLMSILEVYAKV